MSFTEALADELKDAMRAKDTLRTSTLRMLTAALTNARIATGKSLADGDALAVVMKEVKQRRDSIEQFLQGGRQDLADREKAELAILEAYLPQQLGREEVMAEVRAVIAQVGAAGPSDKGKVMGPLMEKLRGRADGRLVNEVVTELLSG